jgi:hypothetical protein
MHSGNGAVHHLKHGKEETHIAQFPSCLLRWGRLWILSKTRVYLALLSTFNKMNYSITELNLVCALQQNNQVAITTLMS